MEKKYLSKIIATDNEGLQLISACCSGAEIKIEDIKYLKDNKVFLLSLKRSKIETENKDKKVISVCKFEFVDQVKSKNIRQANLEQKLELIGIDYLKNKQNYEISLIFTNNAYITLSTEIIEVTLDDQNKAN
ncbi:MAG: DUF2948 family protein [Candidatus Pelagibacter sp. TMED106]|jgi:hypothetical protein|nr:MAG: DUF2948 family protein [Candidatus Pelagibacter sp. TMED106]|tara:strand:- start:383 stop:778 length:396 start_codon:yes stop_codon:yes gene_type:complete